MQIRWKYNGNVIDLHNPIFKFEDNAFKEVDNNKWKTIIAVIIPVFIVITVIVIVIIVVLKRRQDAYSKVLCEWEMNEESNCLAQNCSDSSTNGTLIKPLL